MFKSGFFTLCMVSELNAIGVNYGSLNVGPRMFFISTSVWVLHTQKAGQNMLFQCFLIKKAAKGSKSMKFDANFSKKLFLRPILTAASV